MKVKHPATQSCTTLPTRVGSAWVPQASEGHASIFWCGKSPLCDSVTLLKDPWCCPRKQSRSFQQVVGKYLSVAVFLIAISIAGPPKPSGAIWDSAKNGGPHGLLRSLPTWAVVRFCNCKQTKSNTNHQCQASVIYAPFQPRI